ncbi:MAG: hypothetical protein H7196_01430 [candidate division SR1 bacterium]|nr:hypothetical protein [candidate division SR1 bacterium]
MKYFSNTSQQANFLINKLEINQDSHGLDIACGSGSCLLEIQKIALNTYGVDIEKSDLVNFFQTDIFKERLPVNNLDFAYCMAPYFAENWWNLDYLFGNISDSLKTDGLFCFDLFNFNSFPVGKTIQKYKINKENIQLSSVKRETDRVKINIKKRLDQ